MSENTDSEVTSRGVDDADAVIRSGHDAKMIAMAAMAASANRSRPSMVTGERNLAAKVASKSLQKVKAHAMRDARPIPETPNP
jgi:hypothetical protein